jgi:hypothetical protein
LTRRGKVSSLQGSTGGRETETTSHNRKDLTMSTTDMKEVTEDTHTAQKIHGCTECGTKIVPGEEYTRTVSTVEREDDREIEVEKRHVRNCSEGPTVIEEEDGQLAFSS